MKPSIAVPVAVVISVMVGALVTGVTSSPHCAVMCGPLAAAQGGGRRGALEWNVGRLFAYVLIGALLGALGRTVSSGVLEVVRPWLPWVVAAGLVLTAFEVTKRLPPLPFMQRLLRALTASPLAKDPATRALALGLVTPLLPCGLLYGVILSATATGSVLGGALVMGAFALGSAPALVAAAIGLGHLPQGRWSAVLRRVVPLVAAGVVVARALAVPPEAAVCHELVAR